MVTPWRQGEDWLGRMGKKARGRLFCAAAGPSPSTVPGDPPPHAQVHVSKTQKVKIISQLASSKERCPAMQILLHIITLGPIFSVIHDIFQSRV